MIHVYEVHQEVIGLPVYYGIAANPRSRFQAHLGCASKTGAGWFSKAIAHFGKSAFRFSVIESFGNRRQASAAEKMFIVAAMRADQVIYNGSPFTTLIRGKHLARIAPHIAKKIGAAK